MFQVCYTPHMVTENHPVVTNFADSGTSDSIINLVPEIDALHLLHLNVACIDTGKYQPVIPHWYKWNPIGLLTDEIKRKDDYFGNSTQLYDMLRECPEVDVFFPAGIRGHGYCEDGMSFVKCI